MKVVLLVSIIQLCCSQETESTEWTTTTWSSTTPWTTQPSTQTSSNVILNQTSCAIPVGRGKCSDLSNYCNFKVLSYTDGQNQDSRATVTCRQHHRLNLDYAKDAFIYDQASTYAYCRCSDGYCEWKFNKGNVRCTLCPAETIQARYGRKQNVIEWDTGVAIYFPITVDKRSEKWNIALDFGAGELNRKRRNSGEDSHNLADDIM